MTYIRIRTNFPVNGEVGEAGQIYEFYIKVYGPVNAPKLTTEGWEIEADFAMEEFADKLRKRYKWVGEVYFAGRSNGWLAIQDKDGKAKEKTLQTIMGLVDEAKKRFIKRMEKEFG